MSGRIDAYVALFGNDPSKASEAHAALLAGDVAPTDDDIEGLPDEVLDALNAFQDSPETYLDGMKGDPRRKWLESLVPERVTTPMHEAATVGREEDDDPTEDGEPPAAVPAAEPTGPPPRATRRGTPEPAYAASPAPPPPRTAKGGKGGDPPSTPVPDSTQAPPKPSEPMPLDKALRVLRTVYPSITEEATGHSAWPKLRDDLLRVFLRIRGGDSVTKRQAVAELRQIEKWVQAPENALPPLVQQAAAELVMALTTSTDTSVQYGSEYPAAFRALIGLTPTTAG